MGKNTWSVFRGFCHHFSVSSDPRAVSCSHKARPGAGASVLSHRTTSCSEWVELSGLRIMFAPRAWNSVAAELEFETASSRQRWLGYSLFLLLSFPIFLFLTQTHTCSYTYLDIRSTFLEHTHLLCVHVCVCVLVCEKWWMSKRSGSIENKPTLF